MCRRFATVILTFHRSHTRTPIQILDEAHDSVTSVKISTTEIITGSVDGHVRTYDLRMGQLRSDYLGHPVTSLQPTKDGSTILAGTLDSTIRLIDTTNGTLLNSFKGHTNESYRTKACFGFGEASVICGDEEGFVWCWDLVSVRSSASQPFSILRYMLPRARLSYHLQNLKHQKYTPSL